jgi:hypothetical protein
MFCEPQVGFWICESFYVYPYNTYNWTGRGMSATPRVPNPPYIVDARCTFSTIGNQHELAMYAQDAYYAYRDFEYFSCVRT